MNTYGIVIPCFNEGQRLNTSNFIEFLKCHENIFFVFVNDGSTDNTHDLLASMAHECSEMIHITELKSNSGKAEAIRCGMNYILKSYKTALVGYWDADLSTPLSEIPRFIHFLTEHQKILPSPIFKSSRPLTVLTKLLTLLISLALRKSSDKPESDLILFLTLAYGPMLTQEQD